MSPLAELCWYLSGSNHAAGIVPYLPDYQRFMEADGTIHGGYGPRLFGNGADNQVHNAISRLRKESSSRRVVIQILDKTDMLQTRYHDIPCTSTVQFLIRDEAVHAVVSMRSNDAWLGLVHDIFAFTMLQEIVARDLGKAVGSYTHFAASLHLYASALEPARQFISEGLQSTMNPMDPMPDGSPWQGIAELLRAEEQARNGRLADQIDLPAHQYWADLARILSAYNRKQAGSEDEADRLYSEVTLQPMAELLNRKYTRGRH
ncbi:thymidylate synthase [Sanguibacter sp. 26GB23]|uniref:thymidylate synthase n=1 Tax=Sanguibacter sp. 26GB23 TaxID=3156066 RepID=UPI0032AFAF93